MEDIQHYEQIINSKFPVRYKKKQKEKFREFIIEEAQKMGYHGYTVETSLTKNLVFGDLKTAKIIVGAHYDTPFFSRHMTIITRPFGYWIGQFVFIFIFLIILGFLQNPYYDLIAHIQTSLSFPFDMFLSILVMLLGIFLLFFAIIPFLFYNPHNANDNTSGVLGVLSLMKKLKGNEDIAYILFDNEEWGLLGSSIIGKRLKVLKNSDVSVINFDCIGLGEHYGVCGGKNSLTKLIVDQMDQNPVFDKVKYCKKFTYPTDHINFKNSCSLFVYSKAIITKTISLKNYHSPKDKIIDLHKINNITDTINHSINIYLKMEKGEQDEKE